MKDYYQLLGVARDASQDEIKRTFRRLARETHPDANPDDPTAEARFREIAEAYEVLSDPRRRAAYDRGELDPSGLFSSFAGIEDLLNSLFGGLGDFGFRTATASTRGGQPARGPDARATVTLTLEEAAAGIVRTLEFATTEACPRCEGRGAEPGHPPRRCERCGGAGAMRATRRTLLGAMTTTVACDSCRGAGELVDVPCGQCAGERVVRATRSVDVDIPAGIDDRTRLRLTGRGGSAGSGIPPGDLYVDVAVLPDERFRRDGDDLYHAARIGIAEAALGTTVDVPQIGGEPMPLDIPAGTQPGAVFHLPRQGMPRLRGRGRGDLFVQVDVEVPAKLNAEERAALEDFAALRGERVKQKRRRRKKP